MQPRVTVAQVAAETGFERMIPDQVGIGDPPPAEELDSLRYEVDRDRLYI